MDATIVWVRERAGFSVAAILLLANGNPGPTVGGGHAAIVQRES